MFGISKDTGEYRPRVFYIMSSLVDGSSQVRRVGGRAKSGSGHSYLFSNDYVGYSHPQLNGGAAELLLRTPTTGALIAANLFFAFRIWSTQVKMESFPAIVCFGGSFGRNQLATPPLIGLIFAD